MKIRDFWLIVFVIFGGIITIKGLSNLDWLFTLMGFVIVLVGMVFHNKDHVQELENKLNKLELEIENDRREEE